MSEDEELIQQAIEVVLHERKAIVPILQRRLRLGYAQAARIIVELEFRSIIGPLDDKMQRAVLMRKESNHAGAGSFPTDTRQLK